MFLIAFEGIFFFLLKKKFLHFGSWNLLSSVMEYSEVHANTNTVTSFGAGRDPKKTRLNGCGCLDVVVQIEIYTPEIKHSWTGLKMYFLSKMGIFHCYVSLPESKKITVLLIRWLSGGIILSVSYSRYPVYHTNIYIYTVYGLCIYTYIHWGENVWQGYKSCPNVRDHPFLLSLCVVCKIATVPSALWWNVSGNERC